MTGPTHTALPFRLLCVGGLLAVAAGTLIGCGAVPKFRNLAEQRAVRRFGEALAAEDRALLADATTPKFSGSALAHDEAMDDLRLLRLPKGEIEVVAVTDVPEDVWADPAKPESLVIVKTPAPVRQARFRLVREEPGRWLVDDVLSKQQRRGVKAILSVTEQLELLAAVRNFTDVWGSGTHEQRLAVVTPELREDLSALPPARLAELAGWVVDADRVKTLRPEAQMEDGSAAVRFAGRGYTLLVQLKKTPGADGGGHGGAWLVKDAAAENRDGGPTIPSLERACVAMRGLSTFLDAYAAGDKDALKAVTAPRLYTGSLADADLAAVPLPTSADLGENSTFRLDGDTAEVVFTLPPPTPETPAGAVTVVLTDPHRNDPERRTGAFLVDEITLRGGDGEQKLLSTVFTARAAVREFAAAAAAGDVEGLKLASTRDFAGRVWDVADPADLAGLPLADAAATGAVFAERYAGPVTEITLDTAAGPRTFVLRKENGGAKVDDVLAPAFDRPESLKQVCELILPARAYARTLEAGDLAGLHRTSTRAFNNYVWHQLRTVPPAAKTVAAYLRKPLTLAEEMPRGEGATCELRFGSPADGATVTLVREGGVLAIGDVVLANGVRPEQRVAMKQALRTLISEGNERVATSLLPTPPDLLNDPAPAPFRDAAVAPAAFTAPAALNGSAGEPVSVGATLHRAVRHAAFETPAEAPAAPATAPADVPPPFCKHFPAPAGAAAPVPGCDGGACAPFADALPLGG